MSSLAVPGRAQRPTACVLVALVLFASIVVLTAWLGDDCYFTLRTVDNFLRGHGPVWNTSERVQAYTHPLWMLVLTGAIGLSGEAYLTTLACSIAASVAACALLVRSCVTSAAAVLVLVLALLSRTFVDYSTGGLENALSYLLFALFFREACRPVAGAQALFGLALFAGLAAVTRLDTLLIYLPPLAWHAWRASGSQARRPAAIARSVGAIALGLSPLLVWEAFSLLYYGFPFPNTAYSKLGSGVSRVELWIQGVRYLWSSLALDPLALPTIAFACVLPLWSQRRALVPLAAGDLSYCVYVVSIGGDFMAGRFFALPFLVALAILGQQPLRWHRALAALPVLAVAVAVVVHRVDLVFDVGRVPRECIDARGIADERLYYYPGTGLLRSSARFESPVPRRARALGPHLVSSYSGCSGYAAGPETHVLEGYGLSDALLARLPARYRLDWRIGHFVRFVPRGYEATLLSGENRIRDPRLHLYYDHLREVIRGPLLDRSRLSRILDFNLGRYDELVDDEQYRYPLLLRRALVAGMSDTWTFDEGLARLPLEGARLEAARPFRASEVTLDVRGLLGRVVLLHDGVVVWERDFTDGDPGWSLREKPPVVAPLHLDVGDVTANALWIIPIESETELAYASVRPPSMETAAVSSVR